MIEAERPCPWCSGTLPEGADRCPICGAALVPDAGEEPDVPGLTKVDPLIVRRAPAREVSGGVASGIMAWVSGEPPDMPLLSSSTEPAIEPPSDEVRLEMLRLELEARQRELESSIEPEIPGEDSRVNRS